MRKGRTGTPARRLRTNFDALRTERWIAVIRLAVIGIVMAIFAGSDMGQETPRY